MNPRDLSSGADSARAANRLEPVAASRRDAVRGHHYCTYFDRGYLAQGIALWRSLCRHDRQARLTVLALDDFTADVLQNHADESLTVLPLATLLATAPALAAVKHNRSRREFIFTLTPFLVGHLLRLAEPGDPLVYLDADLYFFGDAEPIWAELARGSVLIVPHRFPAWHDDAASYGRFNVGVVGFRADKIGRACAAWWGEQCLASTALDAAAGHYGDQKYLDAWPQRFAGVVESRHAGVNAAPWNWAGHQWEIADDDRSVRADAEPLVVFHFAQFKRISAAWFDSGQLEYGVMPTALRRRLYGEYAGALVAAEAVVKAVKPEFAWARSGWSDALGPWHLAGLRLATGQFWRRESGWLALGVTGRWSGKFMGRYRRWQRRGQ